MQTVTPRLCDRRFDEVVYPSTHNSMSNADEGWAPPNQIHGMRQQLEDGIRGMLIDTHYYMGESYLCHSFCELGNEPLVDGLGKIKAFMDANPAEVITLIIQDAISAEDTEAAFRRKRADRLRVRARPGQLMADAAGDDRAG